MAVARNEKNTDFFLSKKVQIYAFPRKNPDSHFFVGHSSYDSRKGQMDTYSCGIPTTVEMVMDSRLRTNSKKSYQVKAAQFVQFLWNKRGQGLVPVDAFSTRFTTAIDALPAQKFESEFIKKAKEFMQDKKKILKKWSFLCPEGPENSGDSRIIDQSPVLEFFASLKKKDGSLFAKSTFGTARSSLLWLYSLYDKEMPASLNKRTIEFNKGIKRMVVDQQRAGVSSLEEGKQPFDFELLGLVATQLMISHKKEYSFLHAYMLWSWNLMARGGNVASLILKNMKVSDDSLGVIFAQMKNDQEGERKKHVRHVYANPEVPELCPILALAIYLMLSGFASGSPFVFGSEATAYNRFTTGFQRVLKENPSVLDFLDANGFSFDDFGAHSFRKGAVTASLSGVLGGPNAVTVFIRAGWTLNGVESRYALFDKSGDQFLGRVVAGLPLESVKFGSFPPHFKDAPPELLEFALVSCFPRLPNSFKQVAKVLLASAVYHFAMLQERLVLSHPLRGTPFFTQQFAQRLAPFVIGGVDADSTMRLTGIPPSTLHLGKMEKIAVVVTQMSQKFDHLPDEIASKLSVVLEGNAQLAGQITPQMAMTMISKTLEDSGIHELIARLDSGPVQQVVSLQVNEAPVAPPGRIGGYVWGGLAKNLPEHYKIPSVTLPHAFQLWHCGNDDPNNPHISLCQVSEKDVSNAKQRKMFSEYKFAMKRIDNMLKENPKWKGKFEEDPLVFSVNEVMTMLASGTPVNPRTASGRSRRMHELEWTTVAKIMREEDCANKRARVDGSED
jgi:hypothetical protein